MAMPNALAARALFAADRTCCVCRGRGKPVQIHHMDGDPAHNRFENLAVLCLECHALTQLQGGFHRRLDEEQVKLYRHDWLETVSQTRQAARQARLVAEEDVPDLELITSIVEQLREAEEWELLARFMDTLGHAELRDKYIERAIAKGSLSPERRICLLASAHKEELRTDEVTSAAARLLESKDYTALARLLDDLDCHAESLRAYCRSILHKLEQRELFHAARIAREMQQKKLPERIFEEELDRHTVRGELWWQVRCLQELGGGEPLGRLLLANAEAIEAGQDPLLKLELCRAMGDDARFRELAKQLLGGASQMEQVVRLGEIQPARKHPPVSFFAAKQGVRVSPAAAK